MNEKDFTKRPWRGLRPTFRLWWNDGKTWISYTRHTASSKSNTNYLINHCFDPCLQIIHNIFFVSQKSLDCIQTKAKTWKSHRIWLLGLGHQQISIIHRPYTIVSEFLIFPKHIMLISLEKYIYIYIYIYTYIYIYIYIYIDIYIYIYI